ncbi:hypothetical protein Bbelb_018590 [Branchiostoma belcheri]|nr:hypothetical protein Bbelb_018590 [Branchiostoma belcheri]
MARNGENLLQNFRRQAGGGNQWGPSSRWSGLPWRWGLGTKSVEQTIDPTGNEICCCHQCWARAIAPKYKQDRVVAFKSRQGPSPLVPSQLMGRPIPLTRASPWPGNRPG